MEKDTYGSKIRNHLTPLCNIISLINSNKNNDSHVSDDMLLSWIKNSSIADDLQNSLEKLIEISYDRILDDTIYEE